MCESLDVGVRGGGGRKTGNWRGQKQAILMQLVAKENHGIPPPCGGGTCGRPFCGKFQHTKRARGDTSRLCGNFQHEAVMGLL